jgi:hypothetical protein
LQRQQTADEQQRVLSGRRKALEAQIAALRLEYAQEEARATLLKQDDERRELELSEDMLQMESLRGGARPRKLGGRNGKVGVGHES